MSVVVTISPQVAAASDTSLATATTSAAYYGSSMAGNDTPSSIGGTCRTCSGAPGPGPHTAAGQCRACLFAGSGRATAAGGSSVSPLSRLRSPSNLFRNTHTLRSQAFSTPGPMSPQEEAQRLDVAAQCEDVQQLRRLLQQRRTLFRVASAGGNRPLWHRFLWPVQFSDTATEAQYNRWMLASTADYLPKFAHVILLAVLVLLTCLQAVATTSPSAFLWVVLVCMFGCWTLAAALLWAGKLPRLVGVCHTVIGVFIMLATADPTAWVAPSHRLSVQYLTVFVVLLQHDMGSRLQVPMLLCHLGLLYAAWFVALLGVNAHGQASHSETVIEVTIVPTVCVLLLMLVATKQYNFQVSARMEFHILVEWAQQLRHNRRTMEALDAAHSEAMTAKVRAVRATTTRAIQESILGYTCHQLRNPLHALRGVLEILRLRCAEFHVIDKTDVDQLQMLDESAHQLAKVADDVLDFQRLQNGSLSCHPEVVQVRDILEAAVAPIRSQFQGTISTELLPSVPATIFADGARVAQLLAIGLYNAIKFHRSTSPIRIVGTITQPPGDATMLQLEVWNEGDGLGTLDVAALFQPFDTAPTPAVVPESVNKLAATTSRGLGLGLPTSRLLASLLGGEVGLEDRQQFTVYWVRIPLSSTDHTRTSSFSISTQATVERITARTLASVTTGEQEESRLDSRAEPAVSNSSISLPVSAALTNEHPWDYWGRTIQGLPTTLRCLVVDDLQTNRRLLSAMLRKQGHIAVELEDGDQVLGTLQDGTLIDVVLLDIHMVRTDGRDIARLLREQDHGFPIIAVTGNVSRSDIDSYRDAGFDGVLGKPFNSSHLSALLQACQQV